MTGAAEEMPSCDFAEGVLLREEIRDIIYVL
jgi:hypothetical protein